MSLSEVLSYLISWANANSGFITFVSCVLGIPGVFYVGWSIHSETLQRKREGIREAKLKEESAKALGESQWRGIYRLMKQIVASASLLHSSSLQYSEAARTLGNMGMDMNTPYANAGANLVAAIGGLMMELTLIPDCPEARVLIDFFSIKYRTTDSRASPAFADDLLKMNTMVLEKAGGHLLPMPKEWQEIVSKLQAK
jgi:hypothetical protein